MSTLQRALVINVSIFLTFRTLLPRGVLIIIVIISLTFRTLLPDFGIDYPLEVKSIFRTKSKASLTESTP